MPFYGAVILCIDDPNIISILPRIGKRVLSYGLTSQADIYGQGVRFSDGRIYFKVMREGIELGEIDLAPPGRHNVYNALAAVCVGIELEIPFDDIQNALKTYEGVQRRMQLKGVTKGITIVDDYGHHPTEIKATLEAIKEAWPEKRLVVAFQPHRYSRTKALFQEFLTCFHRADYLVMTDIYAASEEPLPDVSAEILLNEIRNHGQRHTLYIADVDKLPEMIVPVLEEGDLFLTLGAGNIVAAGERLLQELKGNSVVER